METRLEDDCEFTCNHPIRYGARGAPHGHLRFRGVCDPVIHRSWSQSHCKSTLCVTLDKEPPIALTMIVIRDSAPQFCSWPLFLAYSVSIKPTLSDSPTGRTMPINPRTIPHSQSRLSLYPLSWPTSGWPSRLSSMYPLVKKS